MAENRQWDHKYKVQVVLSGRRSSSSYGKTTVIERIEKAFSELADKGM